MRTPLSFPRKNGAGNFIQPDDSVDPPLFRVMVGWEEVGFFTEFREAERHLENECIKNGPILIIFNQLNF